jgi:hypothetical protein
VRAWRVHLLNLTDVLLLAVVVCLAVATAGLVALRGAILEAIDTFRPKAQPGFVSFPEATAPLPVFTIGRDGHQYPDGKGYPAQTWSETDPTAAARRVIEEKRAKYTGSLEMDGQVVRRWKDGVEVAL